MQRAVAGVRHATGKRRDEDGLVAGELVKDWRGTEALAGPEHEWSDLASYYTPIGVGCRKVQLRLKDSTPGGQGVQSHVTSLVARRKTCLRAGTCSTCKGCLHRRGKGVGEQLGWLWEGMQMKLLTSISNDCSALGVSQNAT